MTSNNIKRFIKKNIIGYVEADTIQNGTFLLKYPVHDIVGGFCFERSASDNSSVYLWWFVLPLYIPNDVFGLTFGGRLENLNRDQSWSGLNHIDVMEAIRLSMREKETLIKTLIEPIAFYNYYEGKRQVNLRIEEALVYTSIWINQSDWNQKVKNLIKDIDNQFDISIPWIKQIKENMIEIGLTNNPIEILKRNKQNSIKTLKL